MNASGSAHNPNKTYATNTYRKRALILTLLLFFIGIFSILWLLIQDTDSAKPVADIYQNGECIMSIPLASVTELYRFTVTGDNGAINTIEVRHGSIGIISASCPDKLCIHQGFISDSLLPITCLPNRLVIQIRSEKNTNKITTDIIAY